MVQFYNLGMVKILPGYLGQVHHQNGTQSKVGSYHDTNLMSCG